MQEENEKLSVETPVDNLQERLDSLDKPIEEVSTQSTVVPPSESAALPSLDELTLPTEQPQSTTTVQEAPVDLPDTPEAKKFAEDFKQYLGFDISELRGGIKELEEYRQQIVAEKQQASQDKQLSALQQEWGIDKAELDGRMNQIIERFKKYTPEMQARLDTLEGAKLIWAKIEQEMSDTNVPQFQKSSFNGSGGKKFLFSSAEIKAMSKAEYTKNADKILKAYQLGLVDTSR